MNSYVLSGCLRDPVTLGLDRLKETGDALPYMAAFARLLDFAGAEGVTPHTIREYCVRMILGAPGAGGLFAEKSLAPYLLRDIAVLYDLFFASDWAGICRDAAVLPPPPGSGAGIGADCADRMAALVSAADAPELQERLAAFFERDADFTEAAFPVQLWDGAALFGVRTPDPVTFQDLAGLAYQKNSLTRNTKLFLEGGPAADVLLVGGGGVGKSSLIKATLAHFAPCGLRMAELPQEKLHTLPELFRALRGKRRRYLIYIDDLSFETTDAEYHALKVAMEGAAEARPGNALIYATTNRRHLVRDPGVDAELTQSENSGENMSLAGRFGVRLYFSGLTQSEYHDVLELLFERQGVPLSEEIARSADAWAAVNGGRSGRNAKQFVSRYLSQG